MRIDRLAGDHLELDLLPAVGGRAHRLRAWGVDVLRSPDDPARHAAEPFFWGWYPLVPWSNRIPAATFDFGGATVDLPANFGDGSAIHGQAYAAPWEVEGPGAYVFAHRGGAFPWPYTARQRWGLRGATLRLTLSVTNDSRDPMPAGLGIHPWFAAAGRLEVDVPVRAAYRGEGGLARGAPEPLAADHVPHGRPRWGTDRLYTDLTAHEVRLRWPGRRLEASLAFSEAAGNVQLAAFEEFDAVAVEPVTHAGDGHRRLRDGEPGAIAVLGAGETLAVDYRLTLRHG